MVLGVDSLDAGIDVVTGVNVVPLVDTWLWERGWGWEEEEEKKSLIDLVGGWTGPLCFCVTAVFPSCVDDEDDIEDEEEEEEEEEEG